MALPSLSYLLSLTRGRVRGSQNTELAMAPLVSSKSHHTPHSNTTSPHYAQDEQLHSQSLTSKGETTKWPPKHAIQFISTTLCSLYSSYPGNTTTTTSFSLHQQARHSLSPRPSHPQKSAVEGLAARPPMQSA